MDGDCGGGGSTYDGGSSCPTFDNTPQYCSTNDPTPPHHHVYGITEHAPGQEQYYTSNNVVYTTQTQNQYKLQGVVQPGTQVVLVSAAQATQRACQCTAGWVLFGVGFVVSVETVSRMLAPSAATCMT
jgi:hypothetical protein